MTKQVIARRILVAFGAAWIVGVVSALAGAVYIGGWKVAAVLTGQAVVVWGVMWAIREAA